MSLGPSVTPVPFLVLLHRLSTRAIRILVDGDKKQRLDIGMV